MKTKVHQPSVKVTPKRNKRIAAISAELQGWQRKRAIVIKSRIMQQNRLQMIVAGTLGYQAGMKEGDRAKKIKEAANLVRDIAAGKPVEHELAGIIKTHIIGIEAFLADQQFIEAQMLELARELPVAAWVNEPEQRGFGLILLAQIVGEAGDLSNYANPGKLWKRFGCAPFESGGKNQMGSTWRRTKGLSAQEWSEFGYSPRRRSIAWQIGNCLEKGNGGDNEKRSKVKVALKQKPRKSGPYRLRYDETKVRFQAVHPDYKPKRCQLHALLMATKLLLKNLWIEWNK